MSTLRGLFLPVHLGVTPEGQARDLTVADVEQLIEAVPAAAHRLSPLVVTHD